MTALQAGLIAYGAYNILSYILYPDSSATLVLGISMPAAGGTILNYKALHAMTSGITTVRRVFRNRAK